MSAGDWAAAIFWGLMLAGVVWFHMSDAIRHREEQKRLDESFEAERLRLKKRAQEIIDYKFED